MKRGQELHWSPWRVVYAVLVVGALGAGAAWLVYDAVIAPLWPYVRHIQKAGVEGFVIGVCFAGLAFGVWVGWKQSRQ